MYAMNSWIWRPLGLVALGAVLGLASSCRDTVGPTPASDEEREFQIATDSANIITSAITPSAASIQIDVTSSAAGDGSVLSWTHSVGGSDRLLLVGVTTRTTPGLSVTYGGASLTQVSAVSESTGKLKTSLWMLLAPAPGAAKVVVTLAENASNIAAGAASFTGVNQSTPLGTPSTFAGASLTPASTVPSAAGELVFDVVGVQIAPDATPGAGQTRLWNVDASSGASGAHVRSVSSTEAGAARVEMGWTLAGSIARNVAQVAVAIKPSLPAQAPSAITGTASGITQTAATLGGTVNPNGSPTTVSFQYSTSSDLAGAISTATQSLTSGGATGLSQAITGLTAATTYYFRVVASNEIGTAQGAIQSFATAPSPPSGPSIQIDATSSAAGDGTGLSWTHTVGGSDRLLLVGVTTRTTPGLSVTYGGASLTQVSAISESTGKLKTSLWKLLAPAPGAAKVVVTLAESASNIAAGAVSFTGVSQAAPLGAVRAFEGASLTPASTVPSAAGELVFDVVGVQIAPDATPGGGQTRLWNVAATSGASGAHVRSLSSMEAGAPVVEMDWTLAGLTARNVAQLAVAIKPSSTTPPPAQAPGTTTGAASGITQAGATLGGTVSPNGSPTTAWFQYGTGSDLAGATSTPVQSLTSGGATVISQAIAGLTAATTYYFRVVASNELGTTQGAIQSFTTASAGSSTPAKPSLLSATATSPTVMDLLWEDLSNNEDIFRIQWFINGQWRNIAEVGANVTSYTKIGLEPGQSYAFRVRACNASGCANSNQVSGTTPAATLPTVITGGAASGTNALLDGRVNPNGTPTTAWFEYGTQSTLGVSLPTSAQDIGTGAGELVFSASTAALARNTTYYFRIVARNAAGIQRGAIGTFSSPASSVAARLVTFGDSNTDYGYSGTNSTVRVSSYISNESTTRLAASAPDSPFQLAGKIEALWSGSHSTGLQVVNHGVGGTGSGGGSGGGADRSGAGAPHARALVNGVTRFEAEVLGSGYSWNGGEPVNGSFGGPLARVNSFAAGFNDFAYISIGTNDPVYNLTTGQTLANLQWMVDRWIATGHPANHLMITTLAPRRRAGSEDWPALNDGIRALAAQAGVKLIDLTAYTSNDNGINWKAENLHVGDGVHYSEAVRTWLAQQVVAHLASL